MHSTLQPLLMHVAGLHGCAGASISGGHKPNELERSGNGINDYTNTQGTSLGPSCPSLHAHHIAGSANQIAVSAWLAHISLEKYLAEPTTDVKPSTSNRCCQGQGVKMLVGRLCACKSPRTRTLNNCIAVPARLHAESVQACLHDRYFVPPDSMTQPLNQYN